MGRGRCLTNAEIPAEVLKKNCLWPHFQLISLLDSSLKSIHFYYLDTKLITIFCAQMLFLFIFACKPGIYHAP